MDEPEPLVQRQFSIYERHLNFLKSINSDNLNASLRSTIDYAIKNQNNNITSQLFKDFSLYVVIIAFGFVFFLFSINYTTTFEKVLCYIIGIFMVTFGITGGYLIALQSTRRNKTRK